KFRPYTHTRTDADVCVCVAAADPGAASQPRRTGSSFIVEKHGMTTHTTDVAIIGAGPAGSMTAALLCDRGWRVTVIERSHFPRFSIGESLLPICMDSLKHAGMLAPLAEAGFQVKNGVGFAEGERYGHFDFSDQHTPGWSWTWHVLRSEFDQIIATQAAGRGADVRFGETIEQVNLATP